MKQRLLALLTVVCLFGVLATPVSAGEVGSTNVEIGYNAVPSWNGRTVDVEVTVSCGAYTWGEIAADVAQETRNRTVYGSSNERVYFECGDSFLGTGGSTTVTVEVRADGGKWRYVTGEAEATVFVQSSAGLWIVQDTILIGR